MRCHKCYYNNPQDANFCARCGLPLVETKEGERRRAAILFADISGFSKLAKRLDPEIVRDLIDDAFGELIEIIHKYEGTVDKIIGDCIMALFGVPKSQEDAPLRSVITALELHKKFKELARKSKELSDADISIGVNYGLVVTGSHGKASAHTVMGDAVVLAERLQSAEPPGKIYVSESVYQNTNKEIEYQIIRGVRLKGRMKPVSVYEPLNIKARVPIRKLEEGEMIGREEELATLLKAVDSVIHRKGKLISVIGEPGIGKSKLLLEFKKEISRRYGIFVGQDFSLANKHLPRKPKDLSYVIVIEKRGTPYSKNSPYAVLREIINEITKVGATSGYDFLSFVPINQDSYIKYFLSKELTAEEKDKIESMNPQDRKEVTERSLLKFISSQEKPLIFILDDAHWIDDETLKFFLKMREGIPVLSVISYRPMEGVEEIVDKTLHTKIILEGLKDGEILHFAKLRLDCKGLDSSLSGFLLYKSKSNPFYVEELIDSLLEQQKIIFQREIAFCKGEIKLPDKINDLIISRIDRLSEEERELLEVASVIGDNFTPDILNKIANRDFRTSFHSLKKGYLVKEPQGYNFTHAITREAIYESILLARRSKLHKKVATVIEEFNKDKLDEFLEPLAYHYQKAGEIEKAIAYSERGGDRKRKLCLNEEAIKAYKSCISIILKSYKERDRLFQLYEKLGETYESLGEYANAIKSYEESSQYPRKNEGKARMMRKVSCVLLQKGEYERASLTLKEAVELTHPDSEEWKWIRLHQAQLLVLTAELSQAEKIARELIQGVETFHVVSLLSVEAFKVMAIVAHYQGKGKDAFRYREEALKAIKKAGDKEKLSSNFTLLDGLYSDSEQRQRIWFELNFGMWERYTGKPRLAKNKVELGEFYRSQGKYEKAIANYEKSFEIWKDIDNKAGMCAALFFLGKTYQEEKRYKEALSSYEKCLSILKETGRKINIPEVQSAITSSKN